MEILVLLTWAPPTKPIGRQTVVILLAFVKLHYTLALFLINQFIKYHSNRTSNTSYSSTLNFFVPASRQNAQFENYFTVIGISQWEPRELQLCSFRWHWSERDKSGPYGDPNIGPQLPYELIAQSIWWARMGNTNFSSSENKNDYPLLSAIYSFYFVSSHLHGVYPPKIFFMVDFTTTIVFYIFEQIYLKALLRKACSLARKIRDTCLSLWPVEARRDSMPRYSYSAKLLEAIYLKTACGFTQGFLKGKYFSNCSLYLLIKVLPVGQTLPQSIAAAPSSSSILQFSSASSNSLPSTGYSFILSIKVSSSHLPLIIELTSSPVLAANFTKLQLPSKVVNWWENKAKDWSTERLMFANWD